MRLTPHPRQACHLCHHLFVPPVQLPLTVVAAVPLVAAGVEAPARAKQAQSQQSQHVEHEHVYCVDSGTAMGCQYMHVLSRRVYACICTMRGRTQIVTCRG